MEKGANLTTEELANAINSHLKEKKDYEAKFTELDFRLQARLNTLLQSDQAIELRRLELKAVDEQVKKSYADKIARIDSREDAVKLRENKVERSEMAARQKENDLEKRETAISLKEREVISREKEAESRFGSMQDFLIRAKDLLDELK